MEFKENDILNKLKSERRYRKLDQIVKIIYFFFSELKFKIIIFFFFFVKILFFIEMNLVEKKKKRFLLFKLYKIFYQKLQ
jgi:hypothetical protein